MKNKIITILILISMFFMFLLFYKKEQQLELHKILKVVDADKFYIDYNDNNKIEDDELSRLKDIVAFSPVLSDYSRKEANKLNMPISDYLKLGILSKKFVVDNFQNKHVYIKSKIKTGKYYVVQLIYKDDISRLLLTNGLAYLYSNSTNPNYFQFQNLKEIRRNIKELKKLDFLISSKNSTRYYKLDDEILDFIKYGEITLKSNIKLKYHIPKSKYSHNKSEYKKFHDIEMYLINPLQYQKPSKAARTDISKRIIKEINSSSKTIDIALFGMGEQDDILNALRRAKKRGVKIRFVLNSSKDINKIYKNTEILLNEFSSISNNSKKLMHNKFFIFDNSKVLTGSMNISSSGSGGYNSNSVFIFNSPKIAEIYKNEFNEMYSKRFSNKKNKIDKEKVVLHDSIISVYFSPKDDIYNSLILKDVLNAKKEILISAFFLTHHDLINELITKKKSGVNVIILIDALGAMQFKNRIDKLRNAGIPVKVENWGGKNHEKTLIIDSRILISGSVNFSKNAFYKNDENVIKIENPIIASYYRDYFLYLFNFLSDKYLYTYPRSESLESKNSCYDGIDNNFDGKIDRYDVGCIK